MHTVSHIENGTKDTLKMNALTTTVPTANGSVNHTHIDETSLVSPAPHFDDTQYCPSNRVQRAVDNNHSVAKLDTQTPHTPSSSVHFYSSLQEEKAAGFSQKPKAPTPPKEDNQPDYDLPNSPILDLNVPPTHYYSTPADGENAGLVPTGTHYYSSPPREVPDHQFDDYDEAVPFVPSSADPIVTHNYDEIRVPPNKVNRQLCKYTVTYYACYMY